MRAKIACSKTGLGKALHPLWHELRGTVERISYHNPETGYTVVRLAPERSDLKVKSDRGKDRLVTVVGTLADLAPGEVIVVRGSWRDDPKHGWQFMAVDYRTALPATLQGIKRYLGSGLIKGVGAVMAERIVATFGEATLALLDTDPGRLREVPGIGPIRAQRIAETWVERRHIREIMDALQGFGLSPSLAVRIYQQFGEASGAILTQSPYRLAREVWGIGFKTADTIARAVGLAPDAPERLQAGLLHVLNAAADRGHTLLPEADLLRQAADVVGVEAPRVWESLDGLWTAAEVAVATRKDPSDRCWALLPFARAECGLATRLQELAAGAERSRAVPHFGQVSWTAAFGWLAERHGLQLAPEQETAVRMALTCPVSILTGGPGTGKTHTLHALLTLARAKGLRCILAAPTGRAAKRMAEATGHPAGTLHRVLDLRPGGQAGWSPESPLPADLVIVDEASMLDVLLANHLVKALAPGTHLLLVGDPDQLPSVGAGDVLASLLRSGRFPVTRLTRLFRQGAGSGIALNAQRILMGEMPRFGSHSGDCFFVQVDDPRAAAELVVRLVTQRLPARFGFGPGEVQVLSPMYRGETGVASLNVRLQAHLNPKREGKPEARAGGRVYRPGDRVLQLRNDYVLGVCNGELGTVQGVDPVAQELTIVLDDGRTVRYPFTSLFALTHAYAISVHKAQGAEFPAVVIPLLTNHAAMLGRTLVYTALTRARRLVVFVGQPKALRLALRAGKRDTRHTALQGVLTKTLHWRWPEERRVHDGGVDGAAARPWEGILRCALTSEEEG